MNIYIIAALSKKASSPIYRHYARGLRSAEDAAPRRFTYHFGLAHTTAIDASLMQHAILPLLRRAMRLAACSNMPRPTFRHSSTASIFAARRAACFYILPPRRRRRRHHALA